MVEKAVTASTRSPGVYVKVKLLVGPGAAGTAAFRALLIAFAASGGDIGVETEVRSVTSSDEVKQALLEATPGHLAAIKMFEAFGDLTLDIVAATAPTGATASGSYVVAGTPTSMNVFEFDIKGVKIGPVQWAVGETEATYAARVRERISEQLNLPVIPGTGSATNVIDLDAVAPGDWGNDITFGVKKLSGAGGTVVATGARLANGVGTINITNALALVSTDEYDAIGLVTSNTDATDNTTSSNAERLMDHIVAHSEGADAMLQYGFVGHTGTIANAKAGAIGRNSTNITYAYAQNARSLPAEVMGHELGDALRWYTQRANYNRINNPSNLVGSANRNADKLSGNEREDLLRNGVTPYDFQGTSDEVVLVAPITTHSADENGAPDFRCYYQSDVFGMYAVVKDLRVAVAREFPNCSITEDLPANDDALPAGVVERRDVEAFVFDRLRNWVPKGVILGPALERGITEGRLRVWIDEDDDSQVNIFLPFDIVKPAAKFGIVAEKRRT